MKILLSGVYDEFLGDIGRELVSHKNDVTCLREDVNLSSDFSTLPIRIDDVKNFKRLVDRSFKQSGGISTAIIGLGTIKNSDMKRVGPEDWDYHINDTLELIFQLTRNIGRQMAQMRRGKIIIIYPRREIEFDGHFLCQTIDDALKVFVRCAALELALYKVTVNAFSPHALKVDSAAFHHHDELTRIPLKRMASTDEVVGILSFLSSPSSDHVTGHTLRADGGYYGYHSE